MEWLAWEHATRSVLAGLALITFSGWFAVEWRRSPRRTPWRSLSRALAILHGLCGLTCLAVLLDPLGQSFSFLVHVVLAAGLVACGLLCTQHGGWPALRAMKSPAVLERLIMERTRELGRSIETLGSTQERWARLRAVVDEAVDGILTIDETGIIESVNPAALRRSEEALHESEQRFRALTEMLPQLVWSTGPDGILKYASPQWFAFTGASSAHEVLQRWPEIVHPDDRARVEAVWRQGIWNNCSYENEFRMRRHDGHYRWFMNRGVPIRGEDGQVVHFFGTRTDIDDQKRAEEVLRASEAKVRQLNEELEQRVAERTAELAAANQALREEKERFRGAFDAAAIGMAVVDPTGRFLMVNQSLCAITGYDESELLALTFQEITHPDDLDIDLSQVRRVLAGEISSYHLEKRYIHKDRHTVHIRLSASLVRDDQGRPLHFVAQIENITEGKRAEQGRKRFFQLTLDMLCIADIDGYFRLLNPAWSATLGHSNEELLSRPYLDFIHPDDRERTRSEAARLAAGEPTLHFENRYRCRDGSYRDLLWKAVLDQEEALIYAAAHDVTEAKRAEREREATMAEVARARDQALAATRAKGAFLANMSHEIRTPMNGVIGMTELLLGTRLNDLQKSYAETIRTSGDALLTVINDILDLSKIEAGKLTLESAEFDLGTLIAEVGDLLAPRAHQKNLSIQSRLDPRVPARLVGDPVRIRQVLTNLAGNAVKFTDRGAVNIEALLLTEDVAQACLRISVRDTGLGVPEEYRETIFESFTQIEGGSRRRHGGTGLGLAICRNLVGLMGGKLGLDSTPGEGSTFWFELTLEKAAAPLDPLAAELEGLRVLVVDDEEAERARAYESLLAWGCRPEVVGSGVEALAKLLAAADDDRYELVLLDERMPELDGPRTARVIRGSPRFAALPLVLLATVGQEGPDQVPEDPYFAALLTKPLHRADLYSVIRRLRATSARRGSRARDAEKTQETPALGLRILLAEDNEVNRRVAVGMLEQLGCTVDAVENGRDALEVLDVSRHDLVLMDVQMPELDGLEATAAIRAREAGTGQHIPIIAMTAHAMQGDREKCLAAGMDSYLSKPLRSSPLRRSLCAWVAGKSPRPVGGLPTGPCEKYPRLSKALRESCGDNPRLIAEVVEMLLKGIPGRLDRLTAAVQAQDRCQLAFEAHSLKGTFLTVGAESLASACQELIGLAESGDSPAIDPLEHSVREQWRMLREEAAHYLELLKVGEPRLR